MAVRSGMGVVWYASAIEAMNPGVQYPHWDPWQSTMDCWTGWRIPSVARPSAVRMWQPSRDGTRARQLLMERGLSDGSMSSTEQAPQSPSAQPHLAPVQPFRRKSDSRFSFAPIDEISQVVSLMRRVFIRSIHAKFQQEPRCRCRWLLASYIHRVCGCSRDDME